MQDTIAIRVARSTPVHRLRAIPHTACATTATAAIFKPCSITLGTASPQAEIPSAKRMSTIAEGSVKHNQAASAHAYPDRDNHHAKPTWLLAGPGQNRQIEKRSV